MDWFTILIIFIFFVFPLIQQVLDARKRRDHPNEAELPDGMEWTPIEAPEEARGRVRREERAEDGADGGWSEGWGAWPGANERDEESVTVRHADPSARQDARIPERVPGWDVPAPDTVPAPPTRPAPPTAVDAPSPPITVDRPARVAKRTPATPRREPRQPRQPGQPRASKVASQPSPAPIESVGLAARLRSGDEVRRAVVLSEVLGKPLSMR